MLMFVEKLCWRARLARSTWELKKSRRNAFSARLRDKGYRNRVVAVRHVIIYSRDHTYHLPVDGVQSKPFNKGKWTKSCIIDNMQVLRESISRIRGWVILEAVTCTLPMHIVGIFQL